MGWKMGWVLAMMVWVGCMQVPVGVGESEEVGGEGVEAREVFRGSRVLMGTRFEIRVVGTDRDRAERAMAAAFAEVARVEALLSEWRGESEISEVNRRGGSGPVEVGPELLEVLWRAIEVAALTGGAFDPTFASCGHLYSFREERIPTEEELEECLPRIGYEAVEVDRERSTVTLSGEGVRLGIGGIGKGYGVDQAAAVLRARGFRDFLVDGGGDLLVAGMKRGRPWEVGVADPRRPGEGLTRVVVRDRAVVSSGDYERYFERDGVRHHHILDPATGRSASRSVAVTVVAGDATMADALSTGLFVLGPEQGLAVVEELEGVEALFVGADLEVVMSTGMGRHVE